MIALLDGDVLRYTCGFASDAGAKSRGQAHEDLSFCLNGVKKKIESVVNATGAEDYVVFLSHPINSRVEVFPEYKANRDPTHRPHWFREIKDYLLEKHNAVWSAEGDEADDALGIAQYCGEHGDTVICSVDKDLDMIPGNHYNWSKNRVAAGVYTVSEEEGDLFFYKQLVIGDSTDNIPGLFKYKGEKATKKVLTSMDYMDNKERWEYVLRLYDNDAAFVLRNAKLLWIKRTEEDWKCP